MYTRYRYDGQMPMETFVIKADSSTVLTENGLGARGLDYTSVTNSSGTTAVFPIFDAHGNEVASLSRSGSSYSLSNQRSYGVWGEVRQGATTGGPRGRYCGSLGHVQDDETGLVYMRARYYEAGSGRFLSEDVKNRSGLPYIYCQNDPVNSVDNDGLDQWILLGIGVGLYGLRALFASLYKSMSTCAEAACVGLAGLTFIVEWFAMVRAPGGTNRVGGAMLQLGTCFLALNLGVFLQAAADATVNGPIASVADKAIATVNAYVMCLMLFILCEGIAEATGN